MPEAKKVESVGIVGFGRFGQLLRDMLSEDFSVLIHDTEEGVQYRGTKLGVEFSSLDEIMTADAIFYCVPISSFEHVIKEHKDLLAGNGNKMIIDILSVKVHPKEVFETHLPENVEALLTHPMFGPDTVQTRGIEGQRMVMDKFRMSDANYDFWKEYFASKNLRIIEMSAEEHDRMAANSQGLAHFVGRMLEEFDIEATPIDTLGAIQLQEIRDLVSKDTWQLFVDLQTYNPYTTEMRSKLYKSSVRVYNKLIPNRVHTDRLLVGIQGGKGSFNEQAALHYLSKHSIKDYQIQYLHTAENVMRELNDGKVDRGQFAIHNSTGGIVGETMDAMARYRFKIVEEFAIKINHALMVRTDACLDEIDTIMSHPQVFSQCAQNLEKKYGKLKQESGEDELIDPARVAELMEAGEMPKNIATMGSKNLAKMHGLKVIEEDLQDLDDNLTSFLWVERPD